MSNLAAIETRIADLKSEVRTADLNWVRARRVMAAENLKLKTRLESAERRLKEAKQRYRTELAAARANDSYTELAELADSFNSDSERLAQSLAQANSLISQCPPDCVDQLSVWSPENLPHLLQTPDGKLVMRRRGI